MDTRNYCIDCDTPKPCICDIREKKYKFDTSDYVTLKGGVRLIDTNKYHIIPKIPMTKEENDLVARTLGRLLGHDHIFISGQSKEKDESGFPEQIIVCRALGTDLIAAYKRIN